MEDDFTPVLAQGPQAILSLLADHLKHEPGYDLFTILAPNDDGKRLDRLYSTNHEQYPLGAADAVKDDIWFRRLFVDKRSIVANTMDEIAGWLPDYAIFVEQNYFSLLNLPVVFNGQTIGLLNMMGASHHFDDAALEQIRRTLPLAALAILGSLCKPARIHFD